MKLLLHDKKFTQKPTPFDVTNVITPTAGKDVDGNTIYKENHILFKQVDMEVEAIAKALGEDGRTAVLGLFPNENGGFTQKKVIEQQLFFIDIDNSISMNGKKLQVPTDEYMSFEEALNKDFTKEYALFMYHSFNSTVGWDRFRIAFAIDTPVDDDADVQAVYSVLFNAYSKNGKTVCDVVAKNSNRLFYGGKQGYTLVNPSARLNTYKMIKEAVKPTGLSVEDKPAKRVKRKDVTPVQPSVVTDMASAVPTWQLLAENKLEEASERLSVFSTRVSSLGQAEDYIKGLNMREVLGITGTGGFHDIFHDEETPSASIFKGDTGTYFYKCHSSSAPFSGDIFKVVGELTKTGYIGAINLLKDLIGVEIEISTRLQEIIDNYSVFQRQLSSQDLKTNFPQIHNRFWRYKLEVNAIIDIFKEQIREDEDGNFRLITRLTTRSLAKMLGINHVKVARILNLMVSTEIMNKLANNQIPKYIFEEIEDIRKDSGFTRRADVFELKDVDTEFINELEIFCIGMNEKGMSIASVTTKSGAIASMGEEKAKQVFVQENNFNLSVKDREFVEDAIRLIEFSIENNEGWILQNEVKEGLQVKWKSPHTVDDKWKRLFPMIKRETKIERGRITNALRSKYSIDCQINSASTILYYND